MFDIDFTCRLFPYSMQIIYDFTFNFLSFFNDIEQQQHCS